MRPFKDARCAIFAGDDLHSRLLDTFAVVAQHGIRSLPAQCLCSYAVERIPDRYSESQFECRT